MSRYEFTDVRRSELRDHLDNPNKPLFFTNAKEKASWARDLKRARVRLAEEEDIEWEDWEDMDDEDDEMDEEDGW